MKTKFILTILTLALLLTISIAAVSAQTAPTYKTLVAGKVYNADYSQTIEEANVTVTCTHNDTNTTGNTLSLLDGSYLVQFTENQCDFGDSIVVYGFKEGIGSGVGDGTKINLDMPSFDIALGVSNIALIPEFGLMIGALTLASAIGIFFFVRRK